MERNNGYKIISVIGLLIAVTALAIGFASYSATLNITNPEGLVSGDEFSPYVIFTGSPSCNVIGSAKVTSAGTVLEHDWSGVSVTLTKPGDAVTCTASVQNGSLLPAYLKRITAEKPIECIAGTNNPATNFQEACDGMELNFKVDTYDVSLDNTGTVGTTQNTLSSGTITNIVIPAKTNNNISTHDASFTITFKEDSKIADGDFIVKLPTMSLFYETNQ